MFCVLVHKIYILAKVILYSMATTTSSAVQQFQPDLARRRQVQDARRERLKQTAQNQQDNRQGSKFTGTKEEKEWVPDRRVGKKTLKYNPDYFDKLEAKGIKVDRKTRTVYKQVPVLTRKYERGVLVSETKKKVVRVQKGRGKTVYREKIEYVKDFKKGTKRTNLHDSKGNFKSEVTSDIETNEVLRKTKAPVATDTARARERANKVEARRRSAQYIQEKEAARKEYLEDTSRKVALSQSFRQRQSKINRQNAIISKVKSNQKISAELRSPTPKVTKQTKVSKVKRTAGIVKNEFLNTAGYLIGEPVRGVGTAIQTIPAPAKYYGSEKLAAKQEFVIQGVGKILEGLGEDFKEKPVQNIATYAVAAGLGAAVPVVGSAAKGSLSFAGRITGIGTKYVPQVMTASKVALGSTIAYVGGKNVYQTVTNSPEPAKELGRMTARALSFSAGYASGGILLAKGQNFARGFGARKISAERVVEPEILSGKSRTGMPLAKNTRESLAKFKSKEYQLPQDISPKQQSLSNPAAFNVKGLRKNQLSNFNVPIGNVKPVSNQYTVYHATSIPAKNINTVSRDVQFNAVQKRALDMFKDASSKGKPIDNALISKVKSKTGITNTELFSPAKLMPERGRGILIESEGMFTAPSLSPRFLRLQQPNYKLGLFPEVAVQSSPSIAAIRVKDVVRMPANVRSGSGHNVVVKGDVYTQNSLGSGRAIISGRSEAGFTSEAEAMIPTNTKLSLSTGKGLLAKVRGYDKVLNLNGQNIPIYEMSIGKAGSTAPPISKSLGDSRVRSIVNNYLKSYTPITSQTQSIPVTAAFIPLSKTSRTSEPSKSKPVSRSSSIPRVSKPSSFLSTEYNPPRAPVSNPRVPRASKPTSPIRGSSILSSIPPFNPPTSRISYNPPPRVPKVPPINPPAYFDLEFDRSYTPKKQRRTRKQSIVRAYTPTLYSTFFGKKQKLSKKRKKAEQATGLSLRPVIKI